MQETLEVESLKWAELKESIKNNFKAFSSLCDPVYLEGLRDRVNECDNRWKIVMDKLQESMEYLQVSE